MEWQIINCTEDIVELKAKTRVSVGYTESLRADQNDLTIEFPKVDDLVRLS